MPVLKVLVESVEGLERRLGHGVRHLDGGSVRVEAHDQQAGLQLADAVGVGVVGAQQLVSCGPVVPVIDQI